MLTKLIPGDEVQFKKNGRKLRAKVVEALDFGGTSKELRIPIVRVFNYSRPTAFIDREHRPDQKVRWILRKELRKLPKRKLT